MLIATITQLVIDNGLGSINIVVSINITDSASGNPVNGNNIIVNYTQFIDPGPATAENAIIPGQSIEIFSGLYNANDHWIITSTSAGTISPNPGTCDLKINSITPTVESAPGAHDGTITILATSSNGPIQYSLDNVNFQTSNVFTGLAGGSGTVHVIDSLDIPVVSGTPFVCTDSLAFTVPTATSLLISDPSIDLGSGNISRWNAAFNPVYFTYHRKDFLITGITQAQDGSGNILVAVNNNVSAVLAHTTQVILNTTVQVPGSFVYIKTANYSGVFEVMTTNSNSLILNCQWVANDGAGFININQLFPYYQINTQITYVNAITGKFVTITSKNTPDSTGLCICDFKNLLQSILEAKDFSIYNLINYRDMQLSGSYTVKYAPVWTGKTPTWITLTYPYYVIFAAKQLQDHGGGNLLDYVPFQQAFQLAKWLADFINPVYNNGFPFDLGFIFSEYMVNLNVFYKITLLDINQNPLTSQTVVPAFLLNESGTFILNQDASKFIIASQSLVNTPIVQHVGLNRLLINFIPPATCWFFKVQIQYNPVSGTTVDLMQPIVCRIDQNTTDRSVYLRWIGLTGSWNYYRFVYNQNVTLDVADATIVKNYVFDWQNSDTIEDVLNKNAGHKMAVSAENISVDDINGCLGIKVSPKVQMWVGGVKWQTVIVQTGTFAEYDTMLDQGGFNVVFALPSLNIQFQ